MTADPARSPPRSFDRSWLLLAAPLVGLSLWPLWLVAASMAVLALTRPGRPAAGARLLLLLLLAGLGSVPGLLAASDFSELVAAARTAFPLLLGVVLLSGGLRALEGGRRFLGTGELGLLLLGAALLGGGPGLSLGLGAGLFALLLAVLGAPGPEDRALRPLGGQGPALRWLLVAGAGSAALLTVLSLPLPTPPAWETERGELSRVQARIGGDFEFERQLGSNGENRYPQGLGSNQTRRYAPVDSRNLDNDKVILGGLLVMLAVVWIMWRTRSPRSRGRRPAWWELAALAGLLLTGGLLVLGSLTGDPAALSPSGGYAKLGGDGPAGLLSEQGGGSIRPYQKQEWLNTLNTVAFALLLLAAAALVWVGWHLTRPAQPEADGPEPLPTPAPEDTTALHRVRMAYRSALASLTQVGLGRAPNETPGEHAARVALTLPDLAEPLRQLLALYVPVRYGLLASEEGAAQAEAAARSVARLVRPISAPGAAVPALG
ncbi:DUF4129 domain-containing protein [Deinococcus sp. MIMF12]|uniref:DUF4129 domain-containing protein n=1 Tax=Deinococcus rhizophilus TaxID=3049544 RepID=A0ABT7JJU7_9DEIO|nr:DUF4129 domain-containing protein [Deinococcus rhizophilus]MDL2343924.1 DUF4129 domain-containing protein [Deinococcus rhizophilus]